MTIRGDTALQTEVLEDLSDAVNYRHWLASLVAPYLGDKPLEVGGGIGDYAAEWASAGVARVSHGPFPHRALMKQLEEMARAAID